MSYRTRIGASAAALALAPCVAFAQQTEQRDRDIQEIIVTATKREQTLQDVPFSVAALSEDQIRNTGTRNLVDLARNVAGFTMTDLGPGQSQLAIRGISAGQVVRDQPGVKEQVGVYLDESPISIALFTPDLDLFDLERFEVLRGPQGTLFGAGSAAGTVRYITRQPELGAFEGAAELSLSNGSEADFGGAAKGALNVPLGEIAAMRVVGYYNRIPGFIDAHGPGGTVRDAADEGDRSGGRLAVRIQPNEDFAITPRIVYQKLDTDGFPRIDVYNLLANPFTTTQPPIDLGERGQFVQLEEGIEDDFRLADLTIQYNFGNLLLTAISSYTDRDVVVTRDATSLTGSVSFDLGFPDPAVVRLTSPLIDSTDLQAFSQEVRLSSAGEGRFDWLVGAFWQDVDREYAQDLPTPGWDAATGIDNSVLNAPADTPFFSHLVYDFQQLAIFGEGTYHFNEQWDLTAGVRWYDFDEDRILNFGGFFSLVTRDLPGSTSSDGVSPRVILTYHLSDDVQLSAQASRGFRLGGINDPLNEPLCSAEDIQTFGNRPTWDDEKVWNYEIGAKTRTADRRYTFNVAVFYSDIDDLQANTDAGSCSSRIVFNVPKARSMGAEIELFGRPTDSWDFALTASYVDAELRSTVTSTAGGVTRVVDGLEEGNRLPTSPKFQAAASTTYSWPMTNNLNGYANLTVQYVGSSFTQLSDQAPGFGVIDEDELIPFGDPTITSFTFDPELPSYEIGNLRVGVRGDTWELAAFLNNIWDERAFLSLDRERGTRARVGYLTNPPRTYGVQLHRRF